MKKPDYQFKKPVIILAAPRSGSTLLFEILSQAANAWSIGNESHTVIESFKKFSPTSGLCNSNRLDENDADRESLVAIRKYFYSQLRNRDGQRISDTDIQDPLMIEKTPKNALRIPFLNKMFPDAYYIFLYRNPRENISSIMDGWKSGRFETYANLPGRKSVWSFLLPPGWEKMHNKSLEEIAYFQWKSANSIILNDLQSLIPTERWTSVSYSNIVNNTESSIKELCDFCGLEFDTTLQKTCKDSLKMSRYTLSTPSPTKWHKHAKELSRVIPSAKHTLKKIQQIANKPVAADFDIQIPEQLLKQATSDTDIENITNFESVGRNAPCPCGSGKKYKRCHGKD